MILYTQHLINKKIFDFAIQLSLDEIVNTPLYANYNLLTEKEPRLYGVMSPVGLKFVAKIILDTPFVKNIQMDIQEDAWKLIKTLGNELRIKQDEKELKKSYYTQKNSIF